MSQTTTCNFQDIEYFDDRMFVMYLCKGKVEIKDGIVTTTIYHNDDPVDSVWSVVTYRNTHRYPLSRVDSFFEKESALEYIKMVEPETPLVSLDGESPAHLLPYEAYLKWKEENHLKEYIWQDMFKIAASDSKCSEHVHQTKDSFQGIK